MDEDPERPLLSLQDIEFRRKYFLLENELDKLTTKREQYIWEDRKAIQENVKVLPYGEPEFSQLQNEFNTLRGVITGMLFDNYSAQAEAQYLALTCERQQFLTQRWMMKLRNEYDYKHGNRVWHDSESFASLQETLDRIQQELDDI